MKLPAIAALVLVVSLAACDPGDGSPDAAAPASRPTTAAAPPPQADRPRAERAPSVPPRPKVYFGDLSGWLPEVRTAIADLKSIGMWAPLTKHLYRIDLRVRAGRMNVPADRHLADARFWKATIARGTYDYPEGAFCWVRFFPAAMEDDLRRWSSYYAQGLTGSPPPSERQFWAAILGHELSHCPAVGDQTTPEHVALAWERRILDALQAANIE